MKYQNINQSGKYITMKNIYAILILTLLLTACGGDNTNKTLDIASATDVNAVKAERDKLIAQQQEISAKLKTIDMRIDALTPEKKLPLITTFTAKSEKFEHFLELQGNVATKQNLVITPRDGWYFKKCSC
ncbi:hypothetical protein [Lacinutrix neustonica]|uniref:hypothetical protein n=1 Tax=Lacinutrix neustonica TaxID=2980107 RepID=UPI0028BE2B33|nr:hypothetical protein [Lacinutrix neustonica]